MPVNNVSFDRELDINQSLHWLVHHYPALPNSPGVSRAIERTSKEITPWKLKPHEKLEIFRNRYAKIMYHPDTIKRERGTRLLKHIITQEAVSSLEQIEKKWIL